MVTLFENKKFWREFLALYKELPALWKIRSEYYKSRKLKDSGYQILIDKLKELYPDADRKMVTKKINVFRVNYRRELKKMQEFKQSGARSEETYEPVLWYFEDIDFLSKQKGFTLERHSVSNQYFYKFQYLMPTYFIYRIILIIITYYF